jgi:hypothetical protein
MPHFKCQYSRTLSEMGYQTSDIKHITLKITQYSPQAITDRFSHEMYVAFKSMTTMTKALFIVHILIVPTSSWSGRSDHNEITMHF